MTIKVFLGEDHAVMREGLRLILETHSDMKVVGEGKTGPEVVEQVVRLVPDVVVMDIVMPKFDGIEATRRITLGCPSTKVLMLSIRSEREYVSRAIKAGALGYLLKESAGQEVVDAIRAVHAGHRYLSKSIAQTVIEDYAKPRQSSSPCLRDLSYRERQILKQVVEGHTSAEIAETLRLSQKTIETYRSRLMQKLNIRDIPSLVKFAIKEGLTTVN